MSNNGDPHVHHELDSNAEKAEVLGGLGGIAVGATVGIAAGPVGTAVGALAGGLFGAGVASAIVDATEHKTHRDEAAGVEVEQSPPQETDTTSASESSAK